MKIILATLSACLTLSISAQIPNSDFELWNEVAPGVLLPAEWSTSPYPNHSASLTEDSFEGNYSLELVAIPDVLLGQIGVASTFFEIDYVPENFNFYFKSNIDDGAVSVTISFNNGGPSLQSFEWTVDDSIPEWTFVSIPMNQAGTEISQASISIEASAAGMKFGTAEFYMDKLHFGTSTGIKSPDSFSMSFFPNPAQEFIQIENGSERITTLSFFDITGRLVKQTTNLEGRSRVEIADLPNGIYTIKAKTIENKISVRKLVVKK